MAADKSSNGWFIQGEQFRLRKASDPHSSCIGTINSESNRGTSYRCMWRSDGTLGGGGGGGIPGLGVSCPAVTQSGQHMFSSDAMSTTLYGQNKKQS